MIRYLTGSTYGVTMEPYSIAVEWVDGDDLVIFSMVRRGDAMICHMSASRARHKRAVRRAVSEFMRWVHDSCAWCKMMLAPVAAMSGVERMLIRLGCTHIADDNNGSRIYMRILRNG